jgi:hypothetical protein
LRDTFPFQEKRLTQETETLQKMSSPPKLRPARKQPTGGASIPQREPALQELARNNRTLSEKNREV